MIKYFHGDLLRARETIIAHGMNNKGKMGAGLARAVAEKWPKAKYLYEVAHTSGGLMMGSLVWYERAPGRWLVHVITQGAIGRDPNVRYVSYDAVDKGFRNLVTEAYVEGLLEGPIAIPLIGSGLGNGNWTIIEALLNEISKEYKVQFNVYEQDEEVLKKLVGDNYAVAS